MISIVKSVRKKFIAFKKSRDEARYKGNIVRCPICESTYKSFAPFGVGHRPNARCINCGSLERHRLLWLYFKEFTTLFTSSRKKLLHFAPEEVFYNAFSKNSSIEYTAVDLFPEIYDYEGPVKIQKADITNIPYESDTFDVVLCNHVLEHIPDDHKAMTEIKRVLKPTGWCVLQVPIHPTRKETYEDFSITTPGEREKAFGQYDHVRWYAPDYPERLKKAGFKVTVDDFTKRFSEQEIYQFGLKPGEKVYCCTK